MRTNPSAVIPSSSFNEGAGNLKQNLTQGENESEKIQVLIRDREFDFNVTQ